MASVIGPTYIRPILIKYHYYYYLWVVVFTYNLLLMSETGIVNEW